MSLPISRKVKASAIASAVASLVVGLVSTYVVHGEVPELVTALVGTGATALVTFAAGYMARHGWDVVDTSK